MVGMSSELYSKHAKKDLAQQLVNNEIFQIKAIEHEENDNMVQIKGAGEDGLYLFAHSKATELGCLQQYTSEEQTTFFELT